MQRRMIFFVLWFKKQSRTTARDPRQRTNYINVEKSKNTIDLEKRFSFASDAPFRQTLLLLLFLFLLAKYLSTKIRLTPPLVKKKYEERIFPFILVRFDDVKAGKREKEKHPICTPQDKSHVLEHFISIDVIAFFVVLPTRSFSIRSEDRRTLSIWK